MWLSSPNIIQPNLTHSCIWQTMVPTCHWQPLRLDAVNRSEIRRHYVLATGWYTHEVGSSLTHFISLRYGCTLCQYIRFTCIHTAIMQHGKEESWWRKKTTKSMEEASWTVAINWRLCFANMKPRETSFDVGPDAHSGCLKFTITSY